jgi:solute carrier family 30 (zinc transporter), member 9
MGSSNLKVVVSAIAGNSFITVIKFIGWFFSQSPSLLAEAIHSLADSLNQILLLVGLKQSHGAVSREQPTGPGEARYLWNLISAVGVFFLGFGVTAYHGLHALVSSHNEIGPISWIGISVLVVSFIIEFYVFIQAYREVKIQKGSLGYIEFLKESDDPTLIAVLLEDGVAVLGVSLAMLGIGLGQIFNSVLFDIFASLGIAFLLGLMAVLLAFINGKLLIGRSTSIHKEEEIELFIQNQAEIKSVLLLKTQILGAGSIRLSVEVELNSSELIQSVDIKEVLKKLATEEDQFKILYKSSERMIRLTAKIVAQLELKIQENFPEVSLIDLEIT